MVLNRVSIVMPVYNAACFLRRCLDSVAAQTFRDFRVIAVDDGSTDGSGEILDRYEASFPLTRIHQENRGVSAARNRALVEADGEYVMFLDADDVIHPQLLERAVSALEQSDSDYALFDYRKLRDADAEAFSARGVGMVSKPETEMLPQPAFDWFVGERRLPAPWQFLFRRQTLGEAPFAADIAIYEDVPFVLGYLAKARKGVHLRSDLYGYVIQVRSQSHNSPILRRLAGVEAGMRLMHERLDARQYRLYAKTCCASWVMDLWREIHRLPRGAERTQGRAALYAFVWRVMGEGLLVWRDFRIGRRVRLLRAWLGGAGR